jgi:hypothetical protein
MTIVTDNVSRSKPKSLSLFQELTISFVILASLTAVIAIIFTASVIPIILLFFIVSFAAIPYTLLVTFFAIVRRKQAKKNVIVALREGYTVLEEYKDIANFKTRWQRWTLSFNIILAIAYVPLILSIVSAEFAPTMVVGGSVALVGAIFMVVLNRPFIYNPLAIEAEAYGLTTNTTASTFILVNRVWSWITWYAYCFVSVWVISAFI